MRPIEQLVIHKRFNSLSEREWEIKEEQNRFRIYNDTFLPERGVFVSSENLECDITACEAIEDYKDWKGLSDDG